MKKLSMIIMFIITLFASVKIYAQVDTLLVEKQYRNGYVSFAKMKNGKSAAMKAGMNAIISELTGNRGDISFEKSVTDVSYKNDFKIQQEKYQLYKNGIKLRGGEYVINFVSDTESFLHGFFAPISDEVFILDAGTCVELALKHFNVSHNISDIVKETEGIMDTVNAIYYYDNVAEKFRSAWQVKITSTNSAYSENIFISAATGEFMGAENLICDVNFTGTTQILTWVPIG